ncbi:UNVERIFIED_CONTAM: 11-beta-hydroxysteroid dehydrogenase 1A [Sesamum angustifolium]|uniref:11-beta-hydroxysteroid dehydrogenase 1A n=1 Tax=Sesamum angustifolium TaxID=2727405 RepID=A0AAW2LK43_9LAMI
MRDVQINTTPIMRVESAARSIVRSAIRGERYVTEPAWFRVTYLWKQLCPEVVEWVFRVMYLASPGHPQKETFGKKVLDYTGAKSLLYPETVQVPEPKND